MIPRQSHRHDGLITSQVMMCSEATMKLMLILAILPCIISGLNLMCPDVAEVNTAATLRCSFQGPATIYYDSPVVQDFAQCFENLDRPCNSRNGLYKIARVNTNTTNLEIVSVQISDEGNWTCRNPNTLANSTCPLVLRRTPSCDISSSTEKSQQIDDNVEITLSVNITNHYCSVSATLILQVGTTRHKLKKVDSDIYNITFNVTTSHFGSLELLFICNNVMRNVPCGGVTFLKTEATTTEQDTRPPVSVNAGVPNNKVVIIAGSIAAVVIIIVIIIVFIIVWKLRHSSTKRKSQKSDRNRSTKVDNVDNERSSNTRSESNGIYAVSPVKNTEYDIPWDKKSWSLQKLLSSSDQTEQAVSVSEGNTYDKPEPHPIDRPHEGYTKLYRDPLENDSTIPQAGQELHL